ncbi:Smr domain-containing protein [Ceratocystis lukuohia]|uniref:Smr domain-containing protein n=1 Tax=Ceratocystis lukuohia TaxID=2019550 RepID=A0ABR4MPW1_9PEZI
MSESHKRKLSLLVDEFRSLIDEALIVSIASDFNLQKPKQFQKAKHTLLEISQNVDLEEASGFSPDAFGSANFLDNVDTASQTMSHPSRYKSLGESTLTSSPSTSSDSEFGDAQALASVFPSIDPKAISHMLVKCGGNPDQAIDELIRYEERGENYTLPRAIDVFFQPEDGDISPRRNKNKKKKTDPSLPKSEAERLDDIMHLSSLLDCPIEELDQLYNDNQQSQALTLISILETSKELGIEAKDPARLEMAKAFEQEHKHIPPDYFPVVLQVCSPHISDSSKQLLTLLNKHYQKSKAQKHKHKQKLSISYNLAPKETPEIIEQPTNSLLHTKRGAPSARFLSTWNEPTASINSCAATTYQEAKKMSNELHEKRIQALRDAFKLARRSKGQPLLRSGIVVYLERAKSYEAPASAAMSRAADLLVSKGRTQYKIDLHGVTVDNAVRIAVEETRKWWQQEQTRTRITCDPSQGFTIVTGKGLHSVGGQSRIRGPVISALQADGWTVTPEAGMCTVIGRKR